MYSTVPHVQPVPYAYRPGQQHPAERASERGGSSSIDRTHAHTTSPHGKLFVIYLQTFPFPGILMIHTGKSSMYIRSALHPVHKPHGLVVLSLQKLTSLTRDLFLGTNRSRKRKISALRIGNSFLDWVARVSMVSQPTPANCSVGPEVCYATTNLALAERSVLRDMMSSVVVVYHSLTDLYPPESYV